MIASVGAAKKIQKSFKVSSTLKDHKKCFNVIWGSGASVCDSVKGIGGKQCRIAGKGLVKWNFKDVNGCDRILE